MRWTTLELKSIDCTVHAVPCVVPGFPHGRCAVTTEGPRDPDASRLVGGCWRTSGANDGRRADAPMRKAPREYSSFQPRAKGPVYPALAGWGPWSSRVRGQPLAAVAPDAAALAWRTQRAKHAAQLCDLPGVVHGVVHEAVQREVLREAGPRCPVAIVDNRLVEHRRRGCGGWPRPAPSGPRTAPDDRCPRRRPSGCGTAGQSPAAGLPPCPRRAWPAPRAPIRSCAGPGPRWNGRRAPAYAPPRRASGPEPRPGRWTRATDRRSSRGPRGRPNGRLGHGAGANLYILQATQCTVARRGTREPPRIPPFRAVRVWHLPCKSVRHERLGANPPGGSTAAALALSRSAPSSNRRSPCSNAARMPKRCSACRPSARPAMPTRPPPTWRARPTSSSIRISRHGKNSRGSPTATTRRGRPSASRPSRSSTTRWTRLSTRRAAPAISTASWASRIISWASLNSGARTGTAPRRRSIAPPS